MNQFVKAFGLTTFLIGNNIMIFEFGRYFEKDQQFFKNKEIQLRK
jgi:hypothetical protein